MRKNDCIVFGIFDLIYLLTSCLLAKILADVVIKLVNVFIPVDYFGGAVICVVGVSIASLILMSVLTFRDGYRYARFDGITALISSLAAAIIHFALGLLTRFEPLLCGPTRHLSGWISYGSYYNNLEKTESIPFGTLAVVGAIMMLVYAAVMILSGYLGCRKRLRDREGTVGDTEASE